MPEIVVRVSIVVLPQVLRIDLIEEGFSGGVQTVLVEARIRQVVESVAPGVVDRSLETFREPAGKSGG